MDSNGRVSSILFNGGIQITALHADPIPDGRLTEWGSLLLQKTQATYQSTEINSPVAIRQGGRGNVNRFKHLNSASDCDIISRIVRAAFPISVSMLFQIGGTFFTMYYAGHVLPIGMRVDVYAGVALATSFANIFCFSILNGLSSTVSRQVKECVQRESLSGIGVALYRGTAILFACSLPLSLSWFFIDDVFRLIGLSYHARGIIGTYFRIRMTAIPFDIVGMTFEKYLVAIDVSEPTLWASVIFNVFLFCLGFLFIKILGYGYEFLGWAYAISAVMRTISQIWLSLKYEIVQNTLAIPNRRMFEDWYEYLASAIPNTLTLCAEWYVFELIVIFSAIKGPEAVCALSTSLLIVIMAFLFPMGVSIVIADLIRHRAMPDISLVKRLSVLAVFVLIAVVSMCCLVTSLLGNWYMHTMLPAERVGDIFRVTVPYLMVFVSVDGILSLLSGILRGLGKENTVFTIGLIGYYALAAPCSWYFGIFNTKLVPFSSESHSVSGLLLGIVIGAVVQCIVMIFSIRKHFLNGT